VTGIDGAGVDALVSAAELAGEADISLFLIGARTGPVATALAAADFTELFENFASIDEYPGRVPQLPCLLDLGACDFNLELMPCCPTDIGRHTTADRVGVIDFGRP
jgi:hypothetical protein